MNQLREICPAMGMSVEEFLKGVPPSILAIVDGIRKAKRAGTRAVPSSTLIDRSVLLGPHVRSLLLDRVAHLVDENVFGRSEMCMQFAELLALGLNHLGLPAKAVLGESIYRDAEGREAFRWEHAWVRIGDEVVDGNVDCLLENHLVPDEIRVRPYWGPIRETPTDRKLRQDAAREMDPDPDVKAIWWPELKAWIDANHRILVM
jgi:hypothetical protein